MSTRGGLCAAVFGMLALSMLTGCVGLTGMKGTTNPALAPVNHVVIMFQENRAFDSYFGQMTAYRQRNGIPIVRSDGKINDLSGISFSNAVTPAAGAASFTIAAYHTGSVCTEDLSSDWAESHKEMDLQTLSPGPDAPMDGFAQTAFDRTQYAKTFGITLADQTGRRAMGFFDDSDLNYYYFMASMFAMGDAFYSPMPGRTAPNRMYIHAATSEGHAHDPTSALSAITIWEELDSAQISWKIYVTDNPPNFTYLSAFQYFDATGVQAHVVPLSEYFTDAQNGTLPSVSFIETGQFSARDEHPSNFNPQNPTQPDQVNVQNGAQFAASIINALMNSPSWKDSVFFWTTDEGGGAFDHVPPISVPSPDGIHPKDLLPNDPKGDFTITGFRVPNMVISPFARKNYVSHTPMDYTAYLRFIEARFGVAALTNRDAAMPGMAEFFDFTAVPWATPPSPPAQNTGGACDFSRQ
jgi:phospholipase C